MNPKRMAVALGCLALISLLCAATLAAEAEPQVGQTVGNAKLPQPMSDADAKYLGLDKKGAFTLNDTKAPYVLVEQMNTT
ncbi:MAG: hypothetical protein Q7O12_11710 [Deltaproteobacteria bacterium]|nr:hypothetical protein [Deltaproteobacteria bacterium]